MRRSQSKQANHLISRRLQKRKKRRAHVWLGGKGWGKGRVFPTGLCFLACVSNSPTQCLICRRRIKDVLMSGTVARGGARAALSPLRMDSCIADPQQELLIVFKERNLR